MNNLNIIPQRERNLKESLERVYYLLDKTTDNNTRETLKETESWLVRELNS